MIRRILIPLHDLSDRQPVLQAAWRSFPFAELHLLHILPSPQHRVIGSPEAALAEMHLAKDDLAAAQVSQVDAQHALRKLGHGEVVTSHDPAGEILARAGKFDLILMGTRGRRGLDRLLLGSVAERVIREAPVPVLTIRTTQDMTVYGPFTRLLLIKDFSETARQAEKYLLQHFPGADVDTFYVTPNDVPAMYMMHNPAALGILQEHLDDELRQRRERIRADGGELVQGDPAQVALENVSRGQYDLLVIGTQARGPLDRFLQGSVVGQVIRDSAVPVLTVRNVPEHIEDKTGVGKPWEDQNVEFPGSMPRPA